MHTRHTLRRFIASPAFWFVALAFFLATPFPPAPWVTNLAAQTSLTTTTLSNAISDTTGQLVVVASTTGITAPGTGSNLTLIWVDNELMRVTSVNTTTGALTVTRGQQGTFATTHASGATVYLGPPRVFINTDRWGSCTSTNEPYLPLLNVRNGYVWNCINSQWAAQNFSPTGDRLPRVSIAGTAYTILPTDYVVALWTTIGSTVGAKTFTLPTVTPTLLGKVIYVKDESGGISATSHIVVAGIIDGTNTVTGATVIDLKTPFGFWMGYAGSGGWFTLACGNGGGAIVSACR